MSKFISKFILCFSLCFSCLSQATLIHTNLTLDLLDKNFIEYGGYDWAWASPVNIELWEGNTLYAPEFHDGWEYASAEQLGLLRSNEMGLAAFTKKDEHGNDFYVHAVEFWNDVFTDISLDLALNAVQTTDDFQDGFISSEWLFYGFENRTFDTFYVRDINNRPSVAIPEPNILLIFAFALIALGLRKRLLTK